MHLRIIPCRSAISHRFPIPAFIVQGPPERSFEIAFATHPELFLPSAAAHRTARNFGTSRELGALQARSGEMTYLPPADLVRRFVGARRLHFVLASYGARGDVAFTVPPQAFDRAPWIGIAPDLTERSFTRPVFGGRSPGVRAREAVLAWGGDAAVATRVAPRSRALDDLVEYPIGIDVSDAQGVIDWEAVAGESVAFAYSKASEGTGRWGGDHFADNWAGMRDNGIFRGAYHYFHFNVEARVQADNFLDAVGSLDPNGGDMPPMLDVEKNHAGTSLADKLDRIAEWLEIVESTTKMRPIIYTYPDFWQTAVDDSSRFTSYPLWIAHYASDGSARPVSMPPTVPGGWSTWNIWQFTEKGRVKGIRGNVDLDRMNSQAMVP